MAYRYAVLVYNPKKGKWIKIKEFDNKQLATNFFKIKLDESIKIVKIAI